MHSTANRLARLDLVRQLRNQTTLVQKGFTLVELMIVVAIVGVLSAVALPQFLGARDRAAQGAAVGEVVGIAKECAVGMASGTAPDTSGRAAGDPYSAALGACDGANGPQDFAKDAGGSGAAGVNCLGVASAAGDTTATVTVTENGVMTCAWS